MNTPNGIYKNSEINNRILEERQVQKSCVFIAVEIQEQDNNKRYGYLSDYFEFRL